MRDKTTARIQDLLVDIHAQLYALQGKYMELEAYVLIQRPARDRHEWKAALIRESETITNLVREACAHEKP